MNRAVALATALFTIGFAAMSNDASAETIRDDAAPRTAAYQAASPLSHEVKQARVETNGAKSFILNGHRISVPADANAETVIKALKARYPGLKSDTAVSVAD